MTYTVRFHPKVANDLRGIARAMLPHAGAQTTQTILTTLRDTARSLSRTPHRGSTRDDILPDLRAIPSGRRGVICFTVDDTTQTVLIHLIAWGGADWQSRITTRR
ncbi:ParE toxin of type II toxin-antitoxin system, parDE (plasmid) [Antarctobacter heliothermus]|uniref:ParE toxin of type II toxin-antitoxin system, parDE n=1 Tax=Antarctobacter heliothermus TaxID=74033 RepID=A0A222EAV1_9RHOB|nr:type II toxin-antitoxin system RelE/ParE family toxin [Antarctobacter heliothermus]ASP23316.1 ParE toxin of type II toxin-antitoxin system, parDE [Antarctobacter heliothermus]